MTEPFEIKGIMYRCELVFAHLSQFVNPKIGRWIERGVLVTRSGNTGKYTTGAHLHALGIRVVQKTWLGGWKAINKDNGYKGYFNPITLIDKKLSLAKYENKLVYSEGKQQGKKHYLVRNGILEYIRNEVEFFISGFEFKDAMEINKNLINTADKKTYQIDYNQPRTVQAKRLLGFAIDNTEKAKTYYKQLF